MNAFWFAYILAFALDGEQFSTAGNTPTKAGVEVRIIEALGPQGLTKAECEAYADGQRKRAAATLKLADYRLLKYQCLQVALSDK